VGKPFPENCSAPRRYHPSAPYFPRILVEKSPKYL
jgi:hypothetical protein